MTAEKIGRRLAKWLAKFLPSPQPATKGELVELLARLQKGGMFDAEALSMLEGVLQIGDMQIGDVMIPSAEVVALSVDDSFDKVAEVVRASGHSRYPVFDGARERVLGVFLAKDLLQFAGGREAQFKLKNAMRPPEVAPTTKPLNVLLRDFRRRRHMFIVVDEYALPAGLVTIEDILERIVGEIEDEHDKDDDDILQVTDTVARVKGTAGIDDFNRHFNVNLKNKRFTTIGGWLANRMGGVPKKGETLSAYGITFTITEADSRRARAVQVVIKKSPPADGGDTEEGEEEEEDKKTNAPAQEAAEKNA